jgi:hypothetical protein
MQDSTFLRKSAVSVQNGRTVRYSGSVKGPDQLTSTTYCANSILYNSQVSEEIRPTDNTWTGLIGEI